MSHPFMAGVANGLAERGIATMRYQFPYMEQGSKRPDAPNLPRPPSGWQSVKPPIWYLRLLVLLVASRFWRSHDFASPSGFTVVRRPP
jgi:predicted alpha/beta-hydrolase family hydrolase